MEFKELWLFQVCESRVYSLSLGDMFEGDLLDLKEIIGSVLVLVIFCPLNWIYKMSLNNPQVS